MSQAEGVRAAAGELHDQRIGVGKVFHLFRLPEELEQSFHRLLHDEEICAAFTQRITSKEHAIDYLESTFGGDPDGSIGPVSVGDVRRVTEETTVATIGQYYLQGFKAESPVFPFLKES